MKSRWLKVLSLLLAAVLLSALLYRYGGGGDDEAGQARLEAVTLIADSCATAELATYRLLEMFSEGYTEPFSAKMWKSLPTTTIPCLNLWKAWRWMRQS